MAPPPEEAAPQLTDTLLPPLGGSGDTLMLDGGLTVMAVRSEYQ